MQSDEILEKFSIRQWILLAAGILIGVALYQFMNGLHGSSAGVERQALNHQRKASNQKLTQKIRHLNPSASS